MNGSMPHALEWFILFGGPGLVLGSVLGGLRPKWKVVVGLIALGGMGLLLGIEYFPEGAEDDDDDPLVLLALAMLTNFGGWVTGLVLSAAAARLVLRARKS
jgi:hypothetical protein